MRTICSSATPEKVALQQSNLDMIMDATNFSVELLDRNGWIDLCNSPECKKHRVAEAIDVLFH